MKTQNIVSQHGNSVLSARIKAVACVMPLTLDTAGSDILWNVGLTTCSDNTPSVAGGVGILKRKVVLGFNDSGFIQTEPITGENYDCTKATGGMATTLTPPTSAGQYRGEDVIPLTGNPLTDTLRLNFTGGTGTLGQYPFYVWLVDDYQNPATAPTIQTPINKYTSSMTITATYL